VQTGPVGYVTWAEVARRLDLDENDEALRLRAVDMMWEAERVADEWCGRRFVTEQTALTAELAADGVTASVTAGDTRRFREAGLLYLGTELVAYSGTNEDEADGTWQFTGLSRAQHGTSAAVHAAASAVYGARLCAVDDVHKALPIEDCWSVQAVYWDDVGQAADTTSYLPGPAGHLPTRWLDLAGGQWRWPDLRIVVCGAFGYVPQAPPELKRALYAMVEAALAGSSGPGSNVSSEKIGDYAVTYRDRKVDVPPEAAERLDALARPVV
jgi:hypothetical protein